MLSHKYKCIFVHIPKAAGKSVEHVFIDLIGLTWETREPLLLRYNSDPQLGPPRLAHLKARQYVSCGHVSQSQFDSYFKFSFVRNPWDRLVSEYKYRRHPQLYDFKTFLLKHLPPEGNTDPYWHIIPQYDFIFDENGNQLVDYIGKFESLQKDFDEVCSIIGIPQRPLPHVNRSLGYARPKNNIHLLLKKIKNWRRMRRWKHNTFKHYSEYYDSEAKEFVADLYEKDIQAFQYNFESLPTE